MPPHWLSGFCITIIPLICYCLVTHLVRSDFPCIDAMKCNWLKDVVLADFCLPFMPSTYTSVWQWRAFGSGRILGCATSYLWLSWELKSVSLKSFWNGNFSSPARPITPTMSTLPEEERNCMAKHCFWDYCKQKWWDNNYMLHIEAHD